MPKHNVLIVGAGFGGLRAAQSLHGALAKAGIRNAAEIFLLDRDPYEIYTPLLYKFAADSAFSEHAVALPLAQILENTAIWMLEDTARMIDLEKGCVTLASGREMKADFIVLAPGSETNYFGIPGLEEYALPFKTFEDAKRLRAELGALPRSAHVVIGGGGPTGVELAAEIRKERKLRVSLIEGSPSLLPGFDPRLAELATKRLRSLGVEIVTETMIAEARRGSLRTNTGNDMPFQLLVWTGGVKVPGWVSKLPLKTEPKGRIEVSEMMCCSPKEAPLAMDGRIYALGDATCVLASDGKPLPGSARAAIEEGRTIAHNIFAAIYNSEKGAALPEHRYHPHRYPYVLPVGGRYAVATIGSHVISGLPAWLFKEAITLNYFFSVMRISQAFDAWLWGLVGG
jgi:NADH dehydrogenase